MRRNRQLIGVAVDQQCRRCTSAPAPCCRRSITSAVRYRCRCAAPPTRASAISRRRRSFLRIRTGNSLASLRLIRRRRRWPISALRHVPSHASAIRRGQVSIVSNRRQRHHLTLTILTSLTICQSAGLHTNEGRLVTNIRLSTSYPAPTTSTAPSIRVSSSSNFRFHF